MADVRRPTLTAFHEFRAELPDPDLTSKPTTVNNAFESGAGVWG